MGQAPASHLVPRSLGSGGPATSSGPISTVQARGAPTQALASCPEESTQGGPAADARYTDPVPGSVGWLPRGTDSSDRGAAPGGPLLSRGTQGCVPPRSEPKAPPPREPGDTNRGAGVPVINTSCDRLLSRQLAARLPSRDTVTELETVAAPGPGMGLSTQSGGGTPGFCKRGPGGRRGSTELPEGLPGRPCLQKRQAGPRPAQARPRGRWRAGEVEPPGLAASQPRPGPSTRQLALGPCPCRGFLRVFLSSLGFYVRVLGD